MNCPCGTKKEYLQCCGRFIEGEQKPKTPEQLMRSRYTAFTQANVDYIADTMKPPAADGFDKPSTRTWAQNVIWLGLTVHETLTPTSVKGIVEFTAYFTEMGEEKTIHERSVFRKFNGVWFYVDAVRK